MTTANPSTPSPSEMRETIAGLTPAERRSLKDPDFIAESVNEPGQPISLDELLRENGQTRRKRGA